MKSSIRILATAVLFLAIACHAQEGEAADQGSSVAIISSVNGEARIAHPAGTQRPDQPKFRGPIIYGDNLSTGKDSSLGLLVGQNSLLTMRELSEVRIAETVRNKQILEVAKGRVCLAVSRSTDLGAGPFTVRTPTSLITARDGTLLSIDVEEPRQTSRIEDQANKLVVLAAMSGQAPNVSVETIHVIEGSVDIVSLAPGSSATSLRTGQSLRVVGGVRGQPFASAPVNCRAQEIQIIPVHTVPPPPAQQMMVQQQMQLASAEPLPQQGVTAVSQVADAGSPVGTVPGGLYVPYTGSGLLGQTTRTTIQVQLP
jgi:hypothetical protein